MSKGKGRGRPSVSSSSSSSFDLTAQTEEYQKLYVRKLQIEERLKLYKDPSKVGFDALSNDGGKGSAHWDNVMKEMAWLAADFSREKNAHTMGRKKITRLVTSYYSTLETKKAKKAKDELLDLKRKSQKISKDIRKFWLKIDRIIAFKQKCESDEVRQKVIDMKSIFSSCVFAILFSFFLFSSVFLVLFCYLYGFCTGNGQAFSSHHKTN